MPIAQYSKKCFDGFTKRTCHRLMDHYAAGRIYQRLYGTLSTICDGHYIDVCLGINCSCTIRNGLSSFSGSETPFQRLGGDDDTHENFLHEI
jgi:hypothetical protein